MDGFQFKQFFIQHDRCAMKVNTDGILLGAVAQVAGCQQILDLGTGTGLVAIMLAQRTAEHCHITALEVEPNAHLQAVENAEKSAWSSRISVVKGDVMQHTFPQRFDLIVSNPPYFSDSLASRNQQRDLARAVNQPHLAWLTQAKSWLAPQGSITFILPCDAAQNLMSQSEQIGLYCTELWRIHTKIGKTAKRMIVTFSRNNTPCKQHELIIYDEKNRYTAEFKVLTQAFYLHF